MLRHGNDAIPADADTALIANSTLLIVHRDQLRDWRPAFITLDEASAFKSATAQRTKAVYGRRSRRRRRHRRSRRIRAGNVRHLRTERQLRALSAPQGARPGGAPRRSRENHAPTCLREDLFRLQFAPRCRRPYRPGYHRLTKHRAAARATSPLHVARTTLRRSRRHCRKSSARWCRSPARTAARRTRSNRRHRGRTGQDRRRAWRQPFATVSCRSRTSNARLSV